MYSYLALGDSYTIGEQVATAENFPNQLAAKLRFNGIEVLEPVIIAVTGWTTDELATAILEHNITDTYTFVSLLIGVNNQYRGRSVEEFKEEFTSLLQQAIAFANGDASKVFVVSIPDWGVTPFAEGKDRAEITQQIDAYNDVCATIAAAHKCSYTYITDSTRTNGINPEFLAPDGLHPSGKEYTIWAERLLPKVQAALIV
jgi:lysophospholipase L1-like esterase